MFTLTLSEEISSTVQVTPLPLPLDFLEALGTSQKPDLLDGELDSKHFILPLDKSSTGRSQSFTVPNGSVTKPLASQNKG